jgi:oxaloacetate decarboxylase alpha subunit
MLTNLENQLREQSATDRLDEVLEEIPRVRKDLGYIPLVTPTSQIVGTQAVLNVLAGERYKSITRETEGVLKGEYGETPAPLNAELRRRVLGDAEPITCRPADLLAPEIVMLTEELESRAAEKAIKLADDKIDDVLTYALFPQVGLKFLEHRGDPEAFEPAPGSEPPPAADSPKAPRTARPVVYDVKVNGKDYRVEVSESGSVVNAERTAVAAEPAGAEGRDNGSGGADVLSAGLAGTVVGVLVKPGDDVEAGQPVLVLEAMKMETEVSATHPGTVSAVHVGVGDDVKVGDALVTVG